MNAADSTGWRAHFRHPSGDTYTVLLKGDAGILEAAQGCRAEEQAHGARCFRVESWSRGAEDS